MTESPPIASIDIAVWSLEVSESAEPRGAAPAAEPPVVGLFEETV